MVKKIIISLFILVLILGMIPEKSVYAESNQVLLVYNNVEKMKIIFNLIKSCGMEPVAVKSVEYSCEMLENYEYLVLQEAEPLQDAIRSGIKLICLGDEFQIAPGVQSETINRSTHALLKVYNNTQSIVVESGFTYISDYSGEPIGSVSFEGKEYPLGVMTDKIMYAPYFSEDDISVFVVAQMLNKYFDNHDGGKMYIMIDEVYPFNDIKMLEMTADKLFKNGIPFILNIMPVYNNTDYPSFDRYSNALKYAQSRNGSLIMHEPIITEYELVGDDLELRLTNAYSAFEENGVNIFEKTKFPYEVSIDMLAAIHPKNELYLDFPIDTVIKYKVFENERELNAALEIINKKWLQIGDYGRNFYSDKYIYQETKIDENYIYRKKEEKNFEFLVDAGNQGLIIIVIFSSIIIMILMIIGYRLYSEKFIRKGK